MSTVKLGDPGDVVTFERGPVGSIALVDPETGEWHDLSAGPQLGAYTVVAADREAGVVTYSGRGRGPPVVRRDVSPQNRHERRAEKARRG